MGNILIIGICFSILCYGETKKQKQPIQIELVLVLNNYGISPEEIIIYDVLCANTKEVKIISPQCKYWPIKGFATLTATSGFT
tara:strand:- start:1114 stop:1362 length:249 start_codon:yes stop_codon:yes gene_type:complete